MSQVIEFNKHVEGNAALGSELSNVTSVADYLAIAQREGFAISEADLEAFVTSQVDGAGAELSDSELEQVSGGFCITLWPMCRR